MPTGYGGKPAERTQYVATLHLAADGTNPVPPASNAGRETWKLDLAYVRPIVLLYRLHG